MTNRQTPFRRGQRVRIIGRGARLYGRCATITEIRVDDLESNLWTGRRRMLVHLLNVDGVGTCWQDGQEIGAGAQHIAPIDDDNDGAAQSRSRNLSLEAA